MPQPDVATSSVIRFGVFELDPASGELRKNGRKVKIEGQPLEVLQVLLETPGQLVSREDLQRRLWPSDTFVDFEHGINSVIKRLRQALDDSAQTPRFIETLPRRGYRFIYPLASDPAAAGQALQAVERRIAGRMPLAGAGLAAIAVVLAIAGLWPAWRNGDARGPVTFLAVLPLHNLTGDAAQEYLLDEIHQELITELNEIRAFKVVARDSVARYKEHSKPPAAVAAALNVDAVLLGEVSRTDQRWHMTIQLVSARNAERLWSSDYDRQDVELASLPREVARAIAQSLRVSLTPQEEARLGRTQKIDPAAYRAYANGRYHLQKWTADGVQKAIRYFQEALDIDATYASAWAGLGEAYLSPGGEARPDDEVTVSDEGLRRRAEAALLNALQFDPTLREPHQALGRMRFQLWDWDGAAREFERAHEVDPRYPGFPVYLLATGSFDRAVEVQKLQARLNPLDYASQLTVGYTAFMAGQFDEAIRALTATIDLDPRIPHAHRELGWAYARKGMFSEAIRECDVALELLRQQRPNAFVAAGCEWVYALASRRGEALEMAQRIEQAPGGGAHRFIRLAHVHDALGDRERALGYLRQAYDARAAGLPRQWSSPMLSDGIKADPRFQELIRRTGNPWARFPVTRPPGVSGEARGGVRP